MDTLSIHTSEYCKHRTKILKYRFVKSPKNQKVRLYAIGIQAKQLLISNPSHYITTIQY